MVADRQRRVAKSESRKKARASVVAQGVQLAVGVRLARAGARQKLPVLICDGAKVQLNAGAETILALCDGSRSREQIVAEASAREPVGPLAADVSAFLDAAEARGWIVDRNHAS
jgi:hypothetical protein